MTKAYNINAQAMPADQQAALYANLPRIKAQERIQQGMTYSDAQAVYDDYLLATGEPAIAAKAQQRWLENFVREQCTAAQNSSR